jgi:hypothetical protein
MQRLSSLASLQVSLKLILTLLTLGAFSLPAYGDDGATALDSDPSGAKLVPDAVDGLEALGWSAVEARPDQDDAPAALAQARPGLALPLNPDSRELEQIEFSVEGETPRQGSQFRTAPDGSIILDLRRQSETYRNQQPETTTPTVPDRSPGSVRSNSAESESASPTLAPLPGLSDPVLNPIMGFSEDSVPLFNPADLAEGPEEANPLSPPLPRLPVDDDYEGIVPSPLLEGPLPDANADYQLVVQPVGDGFVPADGRSRLPIAGQIFDSQGSPVDQDVVVTLTSNAGEFLGADYDDDRLGFQVLARRGQFQVPLRSSLSAQQVLVRAAFDPRQLLPEGEQNVSAVLHPEVEAYAEAEFTTYLRPSLVSGVVDLRLGPGASNFWGSFSDYLRPEDIGDVDFDLDAAIFATGAIGDWLFTGAFNSDRALNERCDGTGLYRDVQACDQRYPVYGDSSTTDFLTPSIDSFYARLQRDSDQPGAEADYIMWGDYNTFEFSRASQEFTATSRQLHGFKGNYSLGPLQLTAMYANNLRPFQRDTITPDGTSGNPPR